MNIKTLFYGFATIMYSKSFFTYALNLRKSVVSNIQKPFLLSHSLNTIPVFSKPQFDPVLISVEGNIGAGKTTILNKLKKAHPEWIFIDEPVEIWTKLKTDKGDSLLEIFYNDRKRWSYTFQNCALLTRYEMIENAIQEVRSKFESDSCQSTGRKIFLTERCLDTDHNVFTRMLRDDGSIDGLELNLYEKLLFHLKKSSTQISGIIYVDTCPSLCFDRIKLRSRAGESNIPLSYLEELDKYQSSWVNNVEIPVIKTEENEFENVEEFIRDLLARDLSTPRVTC